MPALPFRLAAVLTIALFAALATPARAEMCRIADPTGTPLNVRDAPGGAVINRLKNGRKVFKDAIDGMLRADLDAPPDALPVADRGPVDASAGAGSGARDCSAVTDCPVLDSEYSQSTCREPVRDCASYAVPCGSPYSELDVCG